MGGSVFPPCSLAWGHTMVGIMVTSFKRTDASMPWLPGLLYSWLWPVAGHCQPTHPPETPGHSQASLDQFLVGSLLLYPGSCCSQGFVCALQEVCFLVLWKFCSWIPLAFKVKFPGGSQSLCQIPRFWQIRCGPQKFCKGVRTSLV